MPSGIVNDLRHGAVLLKRDATTSALIVLVLALGIGGNVAIFTLLKAAFLDPLPYRDARRLVTITEITGWIPSTSSYREIHARTRTLDQMAFAEHRDMQLTGTGEPARVFAARVTASFFPLLGVNAAIGRTLLEEENQPGRAPAVVLTDAFWRAKMGAEPGVVGRTIRLDGKAALVVGVLPRDFHFDYPTLRIPEPVEIYASYPVDPAGTVEVTSNGRGVPVRVLGRIKDGVTFAQAEADVRRIARELTREQPKSFPNPQNDPSLFTYAMTPLREAIVGNQRSLLWLLLGGVGVLLLIACANTAQLLLARSLRRGREVAIRVAVGATRPLLIRQFLLEGLVLALCGGAGDRGIAAGAQPAACIGASGLASHRIYARDFAAVRSRLRDSSCVEGQPLVARSVADLARNRGRGKPVAARDDRDRGCALRIPVVRRRSGSTKSVDANGNSDGIRSAAGSRDAAETGGASTEYGRS
jgi:predicted permease